MEYECEIVLNQYKTVYVLYFDNQKPIIFMNFLKKYGKMLLKNIIFNYKKK